MRYAVDVAPKRSRMPHRRVAPFSQADALTWVRQKSRPRRIDGVTNDPLRIADFFSGCGGLTLGTAEAARRHGRTISVRMAVDFDADAVAVYRANFPTACVRQTDMADVFDGKNGKNVT